jgi:ribosome-associated translation inhibitor RaiA
MQIELQALNFPITDDLREHIHRRLGFALSSRGDQITGIVVRLSDINGPRGGVDKHCQVRITLAGLPEIVIEKTDADLYGAIDRAAHRASLAVSRRLGKRRTKARSPAISITRSLMAQ